MKKTDKISIIIPCYNEKKTILEVLKKVYEQKNNFNLEIIISDDASSDGTYELLKENSNLYDKIIRSEKNQGKGHAIRNAISHISGEISLIQDADLEYSPKDYHKILEPFFEEGADVVYGSRFIGGSKVRVFYYINKIANFFITTVANILTNTNFTDVETGFKAIKTSLLKKINLKENSFTIEIEMTMKLTKIKNIKIFETGISYSGRTYEEGKKIRAIDGIKAIFAIFKYKFFN
jgi:glycosyltransferase involved in cell wall biosynthesis